MDQTNNDNQVIVNPENLNIKQHEADATASQVQKPPQVALDKLRQTLENARAARPNVLHTVIRERGGSDSALPVPPVQVTKAKSGSLGSIEFGARDWDTVSHPVGTEPSVPASAEVPDPKPAAHDLLDALSQALPRQLGTGKAMGFLNIPDDDGSNASQRYATGSPMGFSDAQEPLSEISISVIRNTLKIGPEDKKALQDQIKDVKAAIEFLEKTGRNRERLQSIAEAQYSSDPKYSQTVLTIPGRLQKAKDDLENLRTSLESLQKDMKSRRAEPQETLAAFEQLTGKVLEVRGGVVKAMTQLIYGSVNAARIAKVFDLDTRATLLTGMERIEETQMTRSTWKALNSLTDSVVKKYDSRIAASKELHKDHEKLVRQHALQRGAKKMGF